MESLTNDMINSSPSGQNGSRFIDVILKCIGMNNRVLYFDSNVTEICS